ncbi:MAG: tRNA pseudouridine(38-40) synthase TruA, partial [Gammaproteobacteria bacterium]|nr:tRNA pseudouridine(38-40) synthase TruA [Gammaproteobacteria bacterium]
HEVRTTCAGRTDAGVHALGQVVHFDSTALRSERSWMLGSNANLPFDVSVTWARSMAPDFHARFSARTRRYRYVVFNRDARPAVLLGRVAWEHRRLDVDRMREASGYLLGEHDFSSYRGAGCQAKSPVRRIHALTVSRRGPLVIIDVTANAFLLRMVRNIAGVLIDIGCGRASPGWALEVLRARDRTCGGVTAPAAGLYLVEADYPSHFRIPAVPPESGLW